MPTKGTNYEHLQLGRYGQTYGILTPGAVVTTGKNNVDYIVTEYGIAHLRGKTAGERAKALIQIAHPKFREELLYDAKKMNMVI